MLGRWAADIYAEWRWFDAMGALPVYRSQLAHTAAWRSAALVVAFAFLGANLYALRRSIISVVLPRRLGNLEIGEVVAPRVMLAVVLGATLLLAIPLSAGTADWTVFALARIAEPFLERDPFLDRDLMAVMALVPFEQAVRDWAARLFVVTAILIVALYAMTPSLRLQWGRVHVSAYCRRHLGALAAVGLIIVAWQWRLDLVTLTSRTEYGAFEQNVTAGVLRWGGPATVVLAIVTLIASWRRNGRLAALAALVAVAGGPIARAALPRMAERAMAPAMRRDAERPFETARLAFTRRAFGIDEVGGDTGSPSPSAGIGAWAGAVPVWEPAALYRAVFPGSDTAYVAWTATRGGLAATVLAPPSPRTAAWRAVHVDATAATDDGHPLPAIDGPSLAATDLVPSRLVVFPGAGDALIVADSAGRLAAPALASGLDRVAHALHERRPRLALSGADTVPQRVLSHRDVMQRVTTLVPFLTPGAAVVPAIRRDSVYWVVELFTTTADYPLSTKLFFAGSARPYVHHAATALVNGHSGRVVFATSNTPDAIMRTWVRRFPALFRTWGELSAELQALRPPVVEWAQLQASALARVGLPGAKTSPEWALGVDNADAALGLGAPTMHAAAAEADVLAWGVPIVTRSGVVAGAVLATGGRGARTRWVRAAGETRWVDLLDGLQRAADSVAGGASGDDMRRGRVATLVGPSGVTFVQPFYRWGGDGGPAVVAIAAGLGSTVRAGRSVGEALGSGVLRPALPGAAFRSAVAEAYRRMNDAWRRGDWRAFGSAMDALRALVSGRP